MEAAEAASERGAAPGCLHRAGSVPGGQALAVPMPPLLRRPACGHGLLAPSLPLPSCLPSTQPVARWGKRAENCPLKCGTKPGARPCHPAGGAAHPSHAACSCPCCWARFGGLLPSAWSSRARRCCEAHGDGLGAAREVICALGLSECSTEAGSAVPRVGQPQAISTTLTGQDAAHSVPSVTSQMKVFTPWFLGATMSLPRAPAPPGLPGLSPLQLGPAGGTGPGSLAGLGPGERGAQGASTTGMAPVGPHARHRPGAGGGRRLSPHQLFTSVFIEGNVFNNAWRGAAGPFESLPRCS